MVMLYELKKWLGVYYIQFKNRIQDILVAFKLKRIQQRIQPDASCMKKLDPLDKTNLLHALKQASTYSAILRDTGRTDNESGNSNKIIGRISNATSKQPVSSRSQVKSKNVVKSSNTGMQPSNTSKRTATKLDDAIQKQRNFLNGFVKED